MGGAIVPDDWDDTTFTCFRVEWPDSTKWRAILLGALTGPGKESFWDSDTGDVEDAAIAVQDAYDLTLVTAWSVGCDDLPPGIPIPAFKVSKSAGQSLSASTWTNVAWDQYEYNKNSPLFSLAFDVHTPQNEALYGLWHYDYTIAIDNTNQMFVRAVTNPGGVDVALTQGSNGYAHLSWEYIWTGQAFGIRVEVWSLAAANVDIQLKNCHFSGHLVGPVEAL